MKLLNNYWPLITITLLVIVFFWKYFIYGQIPLPADALVGAHVPWIELKWEKFPAGIPIKNQEITDAISQFYPWRSLVGEFWRNAKVPLWNPYMFSGVPFLASLHSAALYPLNIAYLFLSDINAWTMLIFLQILLSAFCLYSFLNYLGLKKTASLLGAVSFAFSGYMIAWLEFATGGHAGIWLPALLLCESKLIETKKLKWLFFVTVLYFFIYTAGDFQVPLYATVTYLLWGIFESKKKDSRKFVKNIFLVLSGLVLGVMVSLPQLLPTMDLFAKSVRLADPYIKEYFYGLMHWEKVANFIWPDFFGNVVTRNYWGKFGYHEYLAFAGTLPLALGIYSLVNKKDKREIFFWVLLAICLLFLFPTPLAFLPYRFSIPALGTSSASRIIYIVDFCIAVLGAYGLNKLDVKTLQKFINIIFCFLVVTLGIALGIIISLYLMKEFKPVPDVVVNLKVAIKNMIPATLILSVTEVFFIIVRSFSDRTKNNKNSGYVYKTVITFIILVTSLELLRFAWKNTPFSLQEFVFPDTKIINFLKNQDKPFRIAGGIPLNLFIPYKLSSAEGYDPLYPARNSEWYSLVNSGSLNALSGRYGLIHRFDSRLIDYANVLYVVDYKKDVYGALSKDGKYNFGIDSPKYQEIFSEGRIKVFKNTQAHPRVWASQNYTVSASNEEIINYLTHPEGSELIILEDNPGISFKGEHVDYLVHNFIEGFNTITFNITLSRDALLFLSESYDPGWSVTIDGRTHKIQRANYIFQSTPITKGEHLVEFKYESKAFNIGKWISFAIIALLLLLLVFQRYQNGKNRLSR